MFTKFYIAPFLKKHSFSGCCSFLLSAAVCLTLQTCTKTASDESMSITTVNVADSVVDNDGIKIVVDNTFAYPHSFSDRQLDTIKMQQLLCKTILGADMRHRGIHKMLREITTNEIDNYRPASRQKTRMPPYPAATKFDVPRNPYSTKPESFAFKRLKPLR